MDKQTMDSILTGFKQINENLSLEHVLYDEDKIRVVATSKYSEVLNSEETLRILSQIANQGGYDTFIEAQDVVAVGKKLYKSFYFRSRKAVLLTINSIFAKNPASINILDLPYVLKADKAVMEDLHQSLKRMESEVGQVIFSAVTDETDNEVIISTYSFVPELLKTKLVPTWVLMIREYEEDGITTPDGSHDYVSFDRKLEMYRRDFRFSSVFCIDKIISQSKHVDLNLLSKWKKTINSIPGLFVPRLVE